MSAVARRSGWHAKARDERIWHLLTSALEETLKAQRSMSTKQQRSEQTATRTLVKWQPEARREPRGEPDRRTACEQQEMSQLRSSICRLHVCRLHVGYIYVAVEKLDLSVTCMSVACRLHVGYIYVAVEMLDLSYFGDA